jgi:hypothetical protein
VAVPSTTAATTAIVFLRIHVILLRLQLELLREASRKTGGLARSRLMLRPVSRVSRLQVPACLIKRLAV